MPERLKNKLARNFESRGSFFQGVLTLVSGTLISRIIALLAIPVLARMYSPAEFGVMAMFTTIGALIAAVACGRYEMAVVLPDDDEDALHLLVASLVIAAIVSLVSWVGFWFGADAIAAQLGTPELADWLWLSPVMIFFFSAFIALRSWAARTGDFSGVSAALVGNTLVSVAVQFFIVFPKRLMEGGLIIGRAVGVVVQTYIVWRYIRKTVAAAYGGGFEMARMKRLLYRYRDFPLYDSWANLLNEASRELPVLLLGMFFNPVIVGFYSVGRRMLGMPVQLFSNAIAQVFFPQAAQAHANGTLAPLARDVYERLTIAAVTPMLMGIAIMQEGVAVFLGADWIESAIYVQWLALSIMVIFITAPFAQLFNVLEQQRARLVYVSIMTVLQVLVLTTAGRMADPVAAVAGFSVVSAVGTLANYLWLLRKAAVPVRQTIAIFAREVAYSLPFVLLAWLAHRYLDNDIAVLAAATLLLGAFGLLRMRAVMGRRQQAVV